MRDLCSPTAKVCYYKLMAYEAGHVTDAGSYEHVAPQTVCRWAQAGILVTSPCTCRPGKPHRTTTVQTLWAAQSLAAGLAHATYVANAQVTRPDDGRLTRAEPTLVNRASALNARAA